MHSAFVSGLLGQSSSPSPSLPAQAQVRVLLIILGVAAVALLGLLILTLVRRVMRRSEFAPPGRASRGQPTTKLTPWEQAGRRAAPVSDGAADDDSTDEPRPNQ